MFPHHDRAVSGAHWPGCGDALHPAGAAGAKVWAAHRSSKWAASIYYIEALGVAQRFCVIAVIEEGNRPLWHICGGHHLPSEAAGLEPLLLFRCLLQERVHLKDTLQDGFDIGHRTHGQA